MEGELKRFYFHCSDGLDLVLDREGIEADGSEVLWWALKAADRLMSALPTYDGWSAWTVSQPIFSGGSLILRRGFWAVSREPS